LEEASSGHLLNVAGSFLKHELLALSVNVETFSRTVESISTHWRKHRRVLSNELVNG
jgi:hypothetical protein